ncbi:MAG: hypothetical protein AAGM22_15255 [Acidobacteriota bacterium]
MAHTAIYRFIRGTPLGADITITLSAEAQGIFVAEAWDVSRDAIGNEETRTAVRRTALVPGEASDLGPATPPAVLVVEGVFDQKLTPDQDKVVVKVGDQKRTIPLDGDQDDSIMAVVFVSP